MNYKTTLILLAALIIVGLAVFFTTRNPRSEEQPPAEKKLLSLASADITKISITTPDSKHLLLIKSGNDWKLEEPVKAPAQNFAVEDLLRSLTDLKSRGAVGSDVQTGVDQPRYQVELTDKSGKTEKLSVGRHEEIADHVYVKLNDDPKVQVVDAEIDSTLNKPIDDYRQMRLFDNLGAAQIQQLTLSRPTEKITLSKSNDGKWTMTQPASMPVESFEVQSMLNTLTGLRAAEFVDQPQSPTSYQFANPRLTVTFAATTQPASTQPSATQPAQSTTITFGRYDDIQKKNIYAQISLANQIVKLPSSSFDSLNKAPLDLRDRAVVDIDPATVTHVVIKRHQAATSQPTTKPASDTELVIDHITPPPSTSSTSKPTTTTTTGLTPPALPQELLGPQPPKWKLVAGTGIVNDNRMTVLLNSLHPLRAEKFHPVAPASQPAAQYTLQITTRSNPNPIEIQISQIPNLAAPQGATGNLNFDADRSLTDTLNEFFNPAPPPLTP